MSDDDLVLATTSTGRNRDGSTGNQLVRMFAACRLLKAFAGIPVAGHENACSSEIRTSPNMNDFVGVMLTQPATIEKSKTLRDDVRDLGVR
eukprot:753680-Hanusia_phi.AAC.5